MSLSNFFFFLFFARCRCTTECCMRFISFVVCSHVSFDFSFTVCANSTIGWHIAVGTQHYNVNARALPCDETG